MNNNLPRGIGYWRYEYNESGLRFPCPSTLVRPGWLPPEARVKLLHYLRSAPEFIAYRGLSHCRFRCGVNDRVMGHREYWDGVWAWPEGLAHYIECHDVILPDAFVRHALSQAVPESLPEPTSHELNWDYWLEWVRQYETNSPSTPPSLS